MIAAHEPPTNSTRPPRGGIDSDGLEPDGEGDERSPWPCIVELAGTPRAGKTTAMHGLRRRLEARGLRVAMVEEQAESCPVQDKRDPDFNLWTASMTLAEIIGASYLGKDVIIVDRGIFDALCWMDWFTRSARLRPEEQQVIDAFLTLRRLVHLVIVMTVQPAEALRRELACRPHGSPGPIVNAQTLETINRSIAAMIRRRRHEFRLMHLDTTDCELTQTLDRVTEAVLARLESPAARSG